MMGSTEGSIHILPVLLQEDVHARMGHSGPHASHKVVSSLRLYD